MTDFATLSPDQLPEIAEIPEDLRVLAARPGGNLQRVAITRLLSKLIAANLAKATRAALYADLAHPADAVALVFSDPTALLNGWYRKTGASGAGAWTQFETLALAINAGVLAAGVSVTAAAIAVAADRALAQAAAGTATAQAGIATSAKDAVTALAGQAGIPKAYNTKALATADLANIAADEVVMVLADESDAGRRNLYRKEGGVLVLRARLDTQPRHIYFDWNNGDDANAGDSPTNAKKTSIAAIAVGEEGCVFRPARGSVWYREIPNFQSSRFSTVRPYGQGNKPIFDGAIPFVTAWTASGGGWTNSITFTNATVGVNGNLSSCWHPALYDEAPTGRVEESGVLRIIGLASIAANKAAVDASAVAGISAFTAWRQGSANPDPRGDNGTTFEYYFRAADATNPNTNGRTLRTVDQEGVASIGEGQISEDIVFRRCGGKDMLGGSVSIVGSGQMNRCEFIEAAVHGMVAGGVEFRECKATAAYHGDAMTQGGGGFHNFRATSNVGRSRGFKIYDCEVEGFSIGVYSHGAGNYTDGTPVEHDTFDIDGLVATRCGTIFAPGINQRGARARRILSTDCGSICPVLPDAGAVIEDSFIVMSASAIGALFPAYGTYAKVKLKNTLVYCPSASTQISDALGLGAVSKPEMPTLILENSTLIGTFPDPGNALRCQQNWTLLNSVMGILGTGGGVAIWVTGDIIADATSSIEFNRASIEDVRAAHPGVAAGAVSGIKRQTWEKTIVLGDLALRPTGRYASYSGVPNGDGTANLDMDYNDGVYTRGIRVVDAYGAGSHYDGRVVASGAPGNPIVVTPAPTTAFGGKVFSRGLLARNIYKDAIAASISTDGTQLGVPDGAQFKVGMLIRVGNIIPGGPSYGVRAVTAIAGNVLTLDRAAVWKGANNQFGYKNVDGSGAARNLPTVSITFGFPLFMRAVNAETTPFYSVAPVEGGAAMASTQVINGTGIFGAVATQVHVYLTPEGTGADYYAFDADNGYFATGFGLAVGDILTLVADAEVADHRMRFLAPPDKCHAFIPDPECLPVLRGAGFAGLAWGG